MKVPLLSEEKKSVYVNSVIWVVSAVSSKYTRSPESRTPESIIISKEDYIRKFDQQWPEEYKDDIIELLWKHRNVFAMNHNELGKCDLTEHDMELAESQSIRAKYRRNPPYSYESVKIDIVKLLETGVIEPSNSPWTSPISIAVRKDNLIRICLDLCKVNALTRKDVKHHKYLRDV